MPLFMDVHEKLPEGATAKDVAEAHKADMQVQDDYGVKYLRYWVDETNHKVFCLAEAPTPRPRSQCTGRRTAYSQTTSTRSSRAADLEAFH